MKYKPKTLKTELNNKENTIKSIERAIELLFCLSDGKKGLVEIANQVSLSKSTTHRLLATLKTSGLVIQERTGKDYILGPGFYRLLHNSVSEHNALVTLSRESMYRLNKISNETVSIHIPYGGLRLCIAEIKSNQEIIYTAGVGAIAPIHVGAAGKILLAFMPKRKQKQLLETAKMQSFSENTILDKNLLLKEIEETYRNSYAFSFGERIHGSACLAVPILSGAEAIGALCILGPSFRLSKNDLLGLLPTLQKEARIIEQELSLT